LVHASLAPTAAATWSTGLRWPPGQPVQAKAAQGEQRPLAGREQDMLRLTYSTLIVSAMLAMLLFGAMPAKAAPTGTAAGAPTEMPFAG